MFLHCILDDNEDNPCAVPKYPLTDYNLDWTSM